MIEQTDECPYRGKEITRFTLCPCFKQRKYSLGGDTICWFCVYAEYDLTSEELPTTGICRYPIAQTLER